VSSLDFSSKEPLWSNDSCSVTAFLIFFFDFFSEESTLSSSFLFFWDFSLSSNDSFWVPLFSTVSSSTFTNFLDFFFLLFSFGEESFSDDSSISVSSLDFSSKELLSFNDSCSVTAFFIFLDFFSEKFSSFLFSLSNDSSVTAFCRFFSEVSSEESASSSNLLFFLGFSLVEWSSLDACSSFFCSTDTKNALQRSWAGNVLTQSSNLLPNPLLSQLSRTFTGFHWVKWFRTSSKTSSFSSLVREHVE